MSPHEIAAQMLGCDIDDVPAGVRDDLDDINAFIVRCPFPDDFPPMIGLRSRQVVASVLVRYGHRPRQES